jgi:hypothetical protein
MIGGALRGRGGQVILTPATSFAPALRVLTQMR